MNRRNFLHNIPFLSSIPLGAGGMTTTNSMLELIEKLTYTKPGNEEYWDEIKASFNLSPEILDFNSAGLSPMTKQVFQEYIDRTRQFYELPSKGIHLLRQSKRKMIEMLAGMVNCSTDEIVLQRNATEALTTAIFGIPLEKGDEVIVSNYDYPHLFYAWKQRAQRDGITLKYAKIEHQSATPKKIIKSYLDQISSKTKAIFITDLINYSGCQVPTKKIISKLPDHVRYRIVDAAQSFANSRNDFKEFGATHVGTSLHKWLGAPAAGGLLYVHKEFIEDTWPLLASPAKQRSIINKFAHIGTINMAMIPAIVLAIKFYEKLGAENKYNRLIELSDYFISETKQVKGLKIISPRHRRLKSNIVLFSIDDWKSKAIHHNLWHDWKIHSSTSNWEDLRGSRVSFNISNSKSDIDRLVVALSKMSK